jgi:hypothetical protein
MTNPEISFVYDYSYGFLEGINNTTKVLKRNGMVLETSSDLSKNLTGLCSIKE